MGGLPNRTRFRDSRYPVLVLVLVLSILGSPLARAQRERTDVILLDNGDRVTGEIEHLEHGLLRVRTDFMGRVDIEWENVEQVTSNYLFEVELSNGERHFGSILPSDDKQYLDVTGEAGPVRLGRMSVVRIAQLENRFLQRWDGSLDVGFSFLRANRSSTFNLGFQGGYRLPAHLTNVRLDSNVSDQKNLEKTTRHTFNVSHNRFFGYRWFTNVLANFEHNNELGLDLRSTGGGGIGRHLIQTNRSEVTLLAGGLFSRENFPSDPSVSSIEAMTTLSFRTFSYSFPNMEVSINLSVIPSLSDLGRLRVAFTSELTYEFFRDFYWKAKMYDDFDSDGPARDAEKNDFGVSTSIGWAF